MKCIKTSLRVLKLKQLLEQWKLGMYLGSKGRRLFHLHLKLNTERLHLPVCNEHEPAQWEEKTQ